MALIAGNAFVATPEWKLGSFIVIEGGGSPSLLRMTIGTGGFSRFGELSAVWVFMARLASLRCSLELNLSESGGNFMTGAAADAAMDAPKRERGMGVIEAVDIGP
jgi:hypothetical protein